jgi:hypothetical protein
MHPERFDALPRMDEDDEPDSAGAERLVDMRSDRSLLEAALTVIARAAR